MKIYAVGIGPGSREHLTPMAEKIIAACDVIVGYTMYLKLIADLIQGKNVIATGMTGEMVRCQGAIAEARRGKKVAVVSSGDAGIYGMASLLMEMAAEYQEIEVVVVPGITAANAAASVLGAPLSNDFVVISLSDLLTPWPVIEKRVEAAGIGDFVTCLYNPQSKKRMNHLRHACQLLLKYKPWDTWCGYVRNALRDGEEFQICTLGELLELHVDMLTTIVIGNSDTRRIDNRLVTRRGYFLEKTFSETFENRQ